MLAVGVTPVGATAPSPVGNINVVVTGGAASAQAARNTTITAANYRDAVRIQGNRGTGGGGLDGCFFFAVGDPANQGTPAQPKPAIASIGVGLDGVSPLTQAICGNPNPIFTPAAYPLWLVQTGTPGRNVLVVPPTLNPANGTKPSKTYGIETFR
jgi:hypothetical protein